VIKKSPKPSVNLLAITHQTERRIRPIVHCNTIFHQMVKLIPRHQFDKLEAEHGTGRNPPIFYPMEPVGTPAFRATYGPSESAGGIANLKARIRSLYHLGVKPVARSTFSDANNGRPTLSPGRSAMPATGCWSGVPSTPPWDW
jgi:hypothetical protein